MYKTQMRFQKLICLFSLIAGAICFLYSLGIMTDLFDSLYSTMRAGDDPNQNFVVPGAYVYYEMQGFNRLFTRLSIGLIVVSLLYFITNTNVRRRYYIGNYIAVGVNVLYSLVFIIWGHVQIESYKAKFLQVDFAALKAYAEQWNSYYTDSTFWFDIHYPVFGIVFILAALQLVNLFWKRKLMKEEGELIGKEAQA
ncbi:MAG: hypothetical protein IKI75_10490 [Lachnospiraceae bacterium]|nr:hypothetical protein [Lachnospiraceae bacterium]